MDLPVGNVVIIGRGVEVVNLITYKEYSGVTGRGINDIISANEYFELRTGIRIASLPRSNVMRIISDIEGVSMENVREVMGSKKLEFNSKFTGYPVLSDLLSAGCKAALNVLYYKEVLLTDNTAEVCYVDITECGAAALECCLNLLNDVPNLIGIIGAALFITGDNTRELPFNMRLRYGDFKVCESNVWADINDCLWEESLHV